MKKFIMTLAIVLALMLALGVSAYAADEVEVPATEEVGENYDTMLISEENADPIVEDAEAPVEGEEVVEDAEAPVEGEEVVEDAEAPAEEEAPVEEEVPAAPVVFTDVAEDAWYYAAAQFAAASGLVEGDTFNPNAVITVADVLKAVEDLDAETVAALTEIAVASGTVNPEVLADPTTEITREQVVVLLWYYAKSTGVDVSVGEDTNILSYEDALEINEYAIPAVQWACGAGILNGYPNGTLKLANSITRAELAQIAMAFLAE